MSVLLPTSFSTVKLALSVWRKHKHVRTVFTSMLISLTFGPYTHSHRAIPTCTYMHVCAHTCIHSLAYSQLYLHSDKHTYIRSHTHLYIITNPIYTLTHIYTYRLYSFFFFFEKIYLLLFLTCTLESIKSLIILFPQSYCGARKKKGKKRISYFTTFGYSVTSFTEEMYCS